MKTRNKKFNFKWKLVENYTAAFLGLIFLWIFVSGMINNDINQIMIAIIILVIAPFLVTFLDKKSSN